MSKTEDFLSKADEQEIVRAIIELKLPVQSVVAISTDKACKPTNVMGMTKAIQERIFLAANISCPQTRFIAVRYGNVLASRGSVVPLFLDQIEAGGPITLTDKKMTRFLLTLDQAVDTVFEAMQFAEAGETYIPKIKAALIVDVVNALVGKKKIEDYPFFSSLRNSPEIVLNNQQMSEIIPYFELLINENNQKDFKKTDKLLNLIDIIHIELARIYSFSANHDIHSYHLKIKELEDKGYQWLNTY